MRYKGVIYILTNPSFKEYVKYKANLHCHSTFSDGKKTPYELKEMYKSHGYSILAITDHETPKNHSYLNDDDFITITGYESYVRPNAECRPNAYDREIHINLFARNHENEAIVCYNSQYCKYITDEQKEQYKKVGSQKPRELSTAYINELVQTAKENGYIASYNHPWWSMEKSQIPVDFSEMNLTFNKNITQSYEKVNLHIYG